MDIIRRQGSQAIRPAFVATHRAIAGNVSTVKVPDPISTVPLENCSLSAELYVVQDLKKVLTHQLKLPLAMSPFCGNIGSEEKSRNTFLNFYVGIGKRAHNLFHELAPYHKSHFESLLNQFSQVFLSLSISRSAKRCLRGLRRV